MKKYLVWIMCLAFAATAGASNDRLKNKVDDAANEIESKVIEWRRDIHAHPELGFEEPWFWKRLLTPFRKGRLGDPDSGNEDGNRIQN